MAFAAALLLVPVVKAQTNPPYILDTKSGFAYNKYLKSTTPNANGEYTIRIETFATGDVNNVPSDIVFVLDMSGSMRYDYIVSKPSKIPETLTTTSTVGKQLIKEEGTNSGKVWYAQNRAFYAKFNPYVDTDQTTHRWIPNTCLNGSNNAWVEGGTVRYYLYSGTYYLVHQETYNSKYYLYFTVSGTKHYLTENGQSTTRPTGTTNRNPITPSTAQTVHKGNLYRFKTRLEILQDAAVAFIEAMSANSTKLVAQGKDPNKLAIVQFSGFSTPRTDIQTTDPGTISAGGANRPDHTYVVRNWINLTSANATTIENSVRNLSIASETPVDAGMRQARLLLAADNTNHNKYVVVFTDGEPRKQYLNTSGTYTQVKNFYNIVKDAMADANLIRRKSGINAEIFTMGLDPSTQSKTFLQWLSSMKLDPVTVTSASSGADATYSGSANPKASSTSYYQDNQNSNFNKIFENIAAHIISNSGSVASVDLISASFQLPANVDPSRVDVYTAQCTGKSGNYLTFGSEVKAPNRGNVNVWVTTNGSTWTQKSMDIDNAITIQTDATTDKVVVGGFDYATLWCGYDAVHSNYHGYKLVFEFPITIKDGVMGGPDVPTNEGTSGLYPIDSDGNIGTTPIIKYPIPEVAIPIRLIIQKKGLAKGESASFTVERKPISGSGTWTYFNSFILTGNGSTTPPEVRMLNLDPSYYYRVKETGWSWSYENAGAEYISTETLDPKVNPIVFTNRPKTDVPKHAEAKSTNTMRTTESEQVTVTD